ncbi:AAA family ATPase [Pararoseomonas indoligenes]|uniref:AAA family ATPase n=1 Tax=Roseomonas indoligenes TaxID=2820811 RepID=A0A940S4P4_9PROT|nr:AAA family ATPase [Pararoseomonas indoligenes]MBP0492194.1 AAA family ATPase [Pararoseomonas indoligenes]
MSADMWGEAEKRARLATQATNPAVMAEAIKAVAEEGGLRVGRLLVKTIGEARQSTTREYIVKGLFYAREFSAIYGPPGSGKSFMGSHIAYAAAQGREVFGRRVKRTKVLYGFLEGEGGADKRLQALADEFGDCPDFCYLAQPLNLHDDPQAVAELIAAAMAVGAQWILIDTLSRAMGGGDENGPEGMGKILSIFSDVRHATGAHVTVIHHTGKDVTRGMRGHNSLHGACDCELEISRPEEDGPRLMRVAKAKDDADGDKLGFNLRRVVLGQDEDGDDITTCLIDPTDAPKGKPKKPSGQMGQALDILHDLIARQGRIPPVNEFVPPHMPCVSIKDWREHAYQRAFTEAKPDAQKKAFDRASRDLIAGRQVGKWGDLVWAVSMENGQ